MKRAEVSGRGPEKAAGSPEKAVRSGKKKPAESNPAEKREQKFQEVLDSVDAGAKKPAERTAGEKQARTVAFLDEEQMNKGDLDAGVRKKSAAKTGRTAAEATTPTKTAKAKTGRAKAKKPNEKITPASILKKMLAFGKAYQIETEQDFIEAARIYAEEAGLIDQMRDQIAEEGLTVIKSYKTGDVPVAHPLLSELPRHVESANKCLATIGTMIGERGARVEKAKRDLDAFRLH